jgi:RHS repeat-associated protein
MPTFTDYLTDPQNPTVVENSVIGNDILFQGRRYDKETNLLYFRARYFCPIMGRFLSVDPMGYYDSMNLYTAFNCNPQNFKDPFGLYDIDFHYYVTFYLMRAKGWDTNTSEIIAGWSQYIDNNLYTRPGPIPIPTQEALFFHFPFSDESSVVKKGDPRVLSFLEQAAFDFEIFMNGSVKEGTDVRLGQALHMYADTWAHAGFSRAWSDELNRREGVVRPNIGHADADYGGKEPDIIILNEENKKKAMSAAMMIYDVLPKGKEKGIEREKVERDLSWIFTIYKKAFKKSDWQKLEHLVITRVKIKYYKRFGEHLKDYDLKKFEKGAKYFLKNIIWWL